MIARYKICVPVTIANHCLVLVEQAGDTIVGGFLLRSVKGQCFGLNLLIWGDHMSSFSWICLDLGFLNSLKCCGLEFVFSIVFIIAGGNE